ncbi:hypothetical protein F4703DRAFT_1790225 [Phycomyces blakesleeanus]
MNMTKNFRVDVESVIIPFNPTKFVCIFFFKYVVFLYLFDIVLGFAAVCFSSKQIERQLRLGLLLAGGEYQVGLIHSGLARPSINGLALLNYRAESIKKITHCCSTCRELQLSLWYSHIQIIKLMQMFIIIVRLDNFMSNDIFILLDHTLCSFCYDICL